LGGKKLSFSWNVAKRMFSKSKYYIMSNLMITIFAQTDKIMINLMIDDAATGWYSAAISTAGITSVFFAAIIDSFRPWIFEQKKKTESDFNTAMVLLYSIIVYASIAQSVFMTAFAKVIIGVLYGSQFEPAVNALRIAVWYTTFSYLGTSRNIWILAEKKQKYLWIMNLSGALLNIVLNFVMIPFLGINGAAVASLITQVFTNVIINIFIKPMRSTNTLMIKSLNPLVIINMLKKCKRREK
jgi:O-antigen/teichoic acid export membrane protein